MTENQPPLESWKEIAGYLQKDITTVRRWERTEKLPVHRHNHKSRSSVYAYASEIDAWRASRKAVAEPVPARPLWKFPAFAATMLLCLVMVGNGVRPVSAQQSGTPKAARQISIIDPSIGPTALSPDGRYMSYTDWKSKLCVRDLVTGNDSCPTNTGPNASPGYAEDSAFSPDGRQIAYVWSLYTERRTELRVASVAGGTPRRIPLSQTNNDYAPPRGWTPDGKQLLVVRSLHDGTGQLAFVNVSDGSIRPLKSFASWQNINASLSPDGRMIAYDLAPDAKTQARDIFLLAADGSREIAVVQNPANDTSPMWSPDGSRILFLSNRTGQRTLWSVPLLDGRPGQAELIKSDLPSNGTVSMSRSGALYYVVPGAGGSNIYSVELGPDGKVSKPPVLEIDKFLNGNDGPSLSPSGEYLAYLSRPGLIIRTLKTGQERLVPTQVPINLGINVGLQWFPDGRSILAASAVPQGTGPNFYKIHLDTGAAELLLRTSRQTPSCTLSHDGKSLFYADYDNDQSRGRIVRYDVETRRETELKTLAGRFRGVIVSPDSKQLAYSVLENGFGVDSNEGIYVGVMPAEGGVPRELFRGSLWYGTARWILSWSPDQRYVIFGRDLTANQGALWRVPVSGGAPEQMDVSMPGTIVFPQFHPDRRRAFFSVNQSSPSELWELENLLPHSKGK